MSPLGFKKVYRCHPLNISKMSTSPRDLREMCLRCKWTWFVWVDQWQNGFILYASREQSRHANTITTLAMSKELKHCRPLTGPSIVSHCLATAASSSHSAVYIYFLWSVKTRPCDTNVLRWSRWPHGIARVETVTWTQLESTLWQNQQCLCPHSRQCESPPRDYRLSAAPANDWRCPGNAPTSRM